jgi:hypothetical protein
MNYGYDFYIDGLILPITPGELTIKIGSKNEVVTLINEGDINILKSPSLIEISFEARFPMRSYPYSREPSDFQTYFNKFKSLKENKTPFRFIVARRALKSKRTWDTNLEMALEEFEIKESADEGDDVIISFELKQYKNYGVKTLAGGLVKSNSNRSTSVASTNTTNTTNTSNTTNTTQTSNKSSSGKRYDPTDRPPTVAQVRYDPTARPATMPKTKDPIGITSGVNDPVEEYWRKYVQDTSGI